MLKFKKIKSSRGFTLIELLASIFIIILITGTFMVNYGSTSKRSGLNLAKQKLASDIRLAQNYSLGSKTYDGVNTPPGGWGVRLTTANPSSYLIFADINNNHAYNVGEAIETKTLPAGVTISSTQMYGNPLIYVDVVFFPPDPLTYINGMVRASCRLVMTENTNNSTAAVTVNFFGLIDTE